MEILKIGICDDDRFALGVIRDSVINILKERKIVYEISTFDKADDMEKSVKRYHFDLLLLDIDMPGTDGITLARELKRVKEDFDIIYISNREDRVFDSLKVNPFGFVRKNHFTEDAPVVIGMYLEKRQKKAGERLVLQTGENTVSVKIDDILYIEGQRKVQKIYSCSQSDPVEVRYSMQELEEELKDRGFIRVHKGYLVNYRHIRVFQGTDIILDSGAAVPLSRRKVQEVKEIYMELMQNEGSLVMY